MGLRSWRGGLARQAASARPGSGAGWLARGVSVTAGPPHPACVGPPSRPAWQPAISAGHVSGPAAARMNRPLWEARQSGRPPVPCRRPVRVRRPVTRPRYASGRTGCATVDACLPPRKTFISIKYDWRAGGAGIRAAVGRGTAAALRQPARVARSRSAEAYWKGAAGSPAPVVFPWVLSRPFCIVSGALASGLLMNV